MFSGTSVGYCEYSKLSNPAFHSAMATQGKNKITAGCDNCRGEKKRCRMCKAIKIVPQRKSDRAGSGKILNNGGGVMYGKSGNGRSLTRPKKRFKKNDDSESSSSSSTLLTDDKNKEKEKKEKLKNMLARMNKIDNMAKQRGVQGTPDGLEQTMRDVFKTLYNVTLP